MNTPTRLAAFAAGLVVAFVAAVGVGNAVGPVGTTSEAGHGGVSGHGGHGAGAAPTEHGGEHGGAAGGAAPAAGAELVPGLAVSAEGYTLRLASGAHPLGSPAPFVFTVLGPSGEPVAAYTPTHDKDLHLIVVRRDTTGFQHLHPERDGGAWTTPLLLERAGSYKVFVDFAPDGRTDAVTLAADVSVPGVYEPQPLPPVSRTAAVDDYLVTLTGSLVAGQESELTLSVTRGGRNVDDLEPYLAAYGHLVALRVGDLAYLHVHPAGEPGDGRTPPGPDIPFVVDVPTAGDYRLYLNFQHEGSVHTAEFTAIASEGRS